MKARTALGLLTLAFGLAAPAFAADRWVGTWASSPQLATPVQRPPGQGFAETTVRQLVRVSIGGQRIRVRLSNAFGTAPATSTATGSTTCWSARAATTRAASRRDARTSSSAP